MGAADRGGKSSRVASTKSTTKSAAPVVEEFDAGGGLEYVAEDENSPVVGTGRLRHPDDRRVSLMRRSH